MGGKTGEGKTPPGGEEGKEKSTPPGVRLDTRCLDDVEIQPIVFLVPGLVPRGKLTLLPGDGGMGKSTIGLDLAASISTGRPAWV